MRRTRMRRRYRDTGPSPATVATVLLRAAGHCEVCLVGVGPVRGMDYELHHRRPRRMGGSSDPATNSASNLLLICLECHRDIESYRADAHDKGRLLHASENPADSAVLLGGGRVWCYLTDDGQYADDPPAVA